MTTPQQNQSVTAWDEDGKPIPAQGTQGASAGATAWDESGKPIPVTVEQPKPKPGMLQRFAEVTTGFQHPGEEFGRELKSIYHNPGQGQPQSKIAPGARPRREVRGVP